MEKKLFKYGNSMAVIIDNQILDRLNITENTPLNMSIYGGKIIVESISCEDKMRKKDFQKKSKEIMDKYAEAFKILHRAKAWLRYSYSYFSGSKVPARGTRARHLARYHN